MEFNHLVALDNRIIDVSNHWLVNLYLRVWPGWCARRTQEFILVRAECPYVQFAAAHVTGTWFAVWGYKQAREGKDPKSLVKGVNRC